VAENSEILKSEELQFPVTPLYVVHWLKRVGVVVMPAVVKLLQSRESYQYLALAAVRLLH
jgi:hypothetical protein